jgi:hypothetical protein
MTHTDVITTDHPLAAAEQRALRRVAGIMIPASAEFGVPGADDETIFADIIATSLAHVAVVRSLVAQLDALGGAPFAGLDAVEQQNVCERFRQSGSPLVAAIVTLVVQCYYRDDRVMRSLGMEPRPPYPKGFILEDGDWSLLDPVRARPKMYRDA